MRVYGKLQLAEGVRDGKNAYRRSTSRKRMAAHFGWINFTNGDVKIRGLPCNGSEMPVNLLF